ncbi:MAG: hypothetical protein HHAS10_01420 [Candidatus Altimarinota bacterium]
MAVISPSFRTEDTATALDRYIRAIKAGNPTGLLGSFYEAEIQRVLTGITTPGLLSPEDRRLGIINLPDRELGRLDRKERFLRRILMIIDYILRGAGNVEEIFRDHLGTKVEDFKNCIDIYYPGANLDENRIFSWFMQIKNGSKTRDELLRQFGGSDN